jgi:hypothetical protein
MRKGGIILSIGSSGGITNNDDFARDIDLYPNRLASYIRTRYGAAQLINKCIPSTTSADMLYNRHWWGNIRADIATIKLGSNDAVYVPLPDWAASIPYSAGLNSGAVNVGVTGTSGGTTLTLQYGTVSSLGITVGMQVNGVGVGVNPNTGASAQVISVGTTTVTVSLPCTSYISTDVNNPSSATFSTSEEVFPASLVNAPSNTQTDSLYINASAYVCSTNHTSSSTMDYTRWTLGSVSILWSSFASFLGGTYSAVSANTVGTWNSSTTYSVATSSRPPSIVVYRPNTSSGFEVYYAIAGGFNKPPSANPSYWKKVQSNNFQFNLKLLTASTVDTTQYNAGSVPTIAYEQNILEIIAQLRSRNPYVKILLCAPYITGANSSSDTYRRLNFRNFYNSIGNISKIASTVNSPVIPVYLGNAWTSPTSGTYLGIQTDTLHLNSKGHKRVFEFTQAEGQALYAANLPTNGGTTYPEYSFQTLDTKYGGIKSIIDHPDNASWFVNWIDI